MTEEQLSGHLLSKINFLETLTEYKWSTIDCESSSFTIAHYCRPEFEKVRICNAYTDEVGHYFVALDDKLICDIFVGVLFKARLGQFLKSKPAPCHKFTTFSQSRFDTYYGDTSSLFTSEKVNLHFYSLNKDRSFTYKRS